MKKHIIMVFSLLFVICAVSPFFADDQEFFSWYVQPNIWVILDTSGSMSSNFGGNSRLYVAKDAIYQVVNDPDIHIRWGFTTFYQEYMGNRWFGSNWAGTQFTPEYAYKAFHIRTPMGDPDSAHIAHISAWIDHDWTPDSLELEANGYTPISNALRGAYVRIRKDALADTTGARWCRQFYVMLITDGYPTHGIEVASYYADTLAKWDARAPNQLAQSCEEADSLRKLRVPASGVNPAQQLDVKTYVIGVGPGIGNLNQIAQHGGTDHYYPANNPQELQDALKQIIHEIISEATSYSGAEVTSIQEEFITQQYEAKMYICSFVPSNYPIWEGHLKAVKLVAGHFDVDLIPDSLVYWDAGDTLEITSTAARTIYTEKNQSLVMFNNANITAADLGVATAGARDSIINTVYGGSPGSVTGYLGAIFHSAPVRIHGPNYFYEDEDFYIYREYQNTNRESMIYAGANDGMVHCFRDSTGEELWAFIPNDQLINLQNLLINHEYYQDANLMAADVWFPNPAGTDSFKNEDEWKTVLIFGQRQGGYCYSALDVTDPYSVNFLFNFNDTMGNLGETWSYPVIFKIHKNTFYKEDERFFAFLGGGYWPDTLYDIYNPTVSPPYGNAFYALDVVNMYTNNSGPTHGTDYWEIPAAAMYSGSMLYPFPTQPSVIDTNLDSYADLLFIGDVGGQLWKVNLNGTDSADIVVDDWEAEIFFEAPKPADSTEDSTWQPMFFSPTAVRDDKRWWVFFGTGDRANVLRDTTVNRFYAVIDSAWSTPVTEADLKRVSDGATGPLTEAEILAGAYKGWYVVFTDFNNTDSIGVRYGEKVTSYPTILMDTLIFTTFQPYELTDPCASASGIARIYKIHYKIGDWTGTTPSRIIGTGIPQSPRYSFDISGEGVEVISLPGEIIVTPSPSIGIRRKILWWHETH